MRDRAEWRNIAWTFAWFGLFAGITYALYNWVLFFIPFEWAWSSGSSSAGRTAADLRGAISLVLGLILSLWFIGFMGERRLAAREARQRKAGHFVGTTAVERIAMSRSGKGGCGYIIIVLALSTLAMVPVGLVFESWGFSAQTFGEISIFVWLAVCYLGFVLHSLLTGRGFRGYSAPTEEGEK